MWFYKGISKSWLGTQQVTLKMIKCVAYSNSKRRILKEKSYIAMNTDWGTPELPKYPGALRSCQNLTLVCADTGWNATDLIGLLYALDWGIETTKYSHYPSLPTL